MTVPNNDPWADDQFAPLDLRKGPQHFATELADIGNEEDFAPEPEPLEPPAVPEIAAAPPAPTSPAYPEPEVVTDPNGLTVTYSQDANGFHASLDPGNGGGIEVFHGRTERELTLNMARAKGNATKKINQLKREQITAPVVQKTDTEAVGRQPTANELFEIKTLQASDPVAAFRKIMEITTGKTPEQLAKDSTSGSDANESLRIETEAKAFVANYPGYYPTGKNFNALSEYLQKKNLDLTRDTLAKAFEDLLEAGLLEVRPKPQPVQTPVAPVPAPVSTVVEPPAAPQRPAEPRIVRTAARANAALGLRANEVSTPLTRSDKAPSDEEMDNLPDDQIEQLFAGVVRHAAQSRSRR